MQSSVSDLERLPVETLVHILSYLGARECNASVRGVCRKLRSAWLLSKENELHIRLPKLVHELDSEMWQTLAAWPDVRRLHLICSRDDACVPAVETEAALVAQSLPYVTHLELTGAPTPTAIQGCVFPRLTHLHLEECHLPGEALNAFLGAFASLRRLWVSEINALDTTGWACRSRLEYLNVCGVLRARLDFKDMVALQTLILHDTQCRQWLNVTVLNADSLVGLANLTGNLITPSLYAHVLRNGERLERLWLTQSGVPEGVAVRFPHVHTLEYLGDTGPASNALYETPRRIPWSSAFPALSVLSVYRTSAPYTFDSDAAARVTNVTYADIDEWETPTVPADVSTLTLAFWRLNGFVIEPLRRHAHLRTLLLKNAGNGKPHFPDVRLTALRELHLENMGLAYARLASLPRLERLALRNTSMASTGDPPPQTGLLDLADYVGTSLECGVVWRSLKTLTAPFSKVVRADPAHVPALESLTVLNRSQISDGYDGFRDWRALRSVRFESADAATAARLRADLEPRHIHVAFDRIADEPAASSW